ncbi:MAG: integrase core domain-containing protein [Candidatus Daviesbacteria bacterium]
MNQLTKITLTWELHEEGIPKLHIARKLEVHRETVHLWIKAIEKLGFLEFLDSYLHAKKGERVKRKVDGLLKARVYKLREENRNCCGQKIQEYLKRDYGVSLGIKAIYQILGEKYLLRSKWKKNQLRGLVPEAEKPRQVIQMDTIDFGAVFAFCGLDIFTKEAVVKLYTSLTATDGLDFLNFSFSSRFNRTELLQTDGGSEFKAEFRSNIFKFANRFRVARPYKKNEQSYIESFNRSLRKECLGWGKYAPRNLLELERELTEYLVYYHTKRVHLGLGLKTPNQFLEEMSDF